MKVEVVGPYGGESQGCRMTCLLINDRIALDAGSLSQPLSLERQAEVHTIVLTHSHMDHTSSLPFFVENVFGKREGATEVYASPATIYAIRKYLFNNATWPDFTRLPHHLLPSIRFHEVADEVPFTIDHVTFTPIPVDHLVPTHGYLVQQDGVGFLWSSDTGPTERLWEIANQTPGIKAVCVETSFDNSLQRVADLSFHLTPATLETQLEKLEQKVPILLHHLKPFCLKALKDEVRGLKNPDIELLEQDKVYDFS